MRDAYLHFGKDNEPRLTAHVEVRETEAPRHRSATGYGPRIPTPYMVKWEGRWRRVYVAQFGNAGSAYIGPRGNWLATVSID